MNEGGGRDFVDLLREQLGKVQPSPTFSYITELALIYRKAAKRLCGAIEAANPAIVCKRGCAECCHAPTMLRPTNPVGRTADIYGLSLLDVVTLIQSFADIQTALGVGIADKILDVAARCRTTMEPQACPFLGATGACGIYEFRPVSCQIWYSADVEICRQNRHHFYLFENPYTQRSSGLRAQIDEPFKELIMRHYPELPFGWYDYHATFEMLAKQEKIDHLRGLRGAFEGASPRGPLGTVLIPGRPV
jgi:Fe-S-cluster containining protein